MKTAATKIAKGLDPSPAKNCNKRTHEESAARGLTLCLDCRKPLFHRPKEKCARHGVWFCSEGCFGDNDLQALRGFKSHEEDENESDED
jgi:hypothetical protein